MIAKGNARLLTLGLTLGALCAPVVAAPPAEQVQTAHVRLHPMAEPRPALKYQLLPPLSERRPGNAAVWWNRLLADQATSMAKAAKPGGVGEKLDRWFALPLGDPGEREFRQREPAITRLGQEPLFVDMDYAARFDTCDWQLPLREGRLISLPFPEVVQIRPYVRLLRAKARLEIGDGRYDQAVRTLQTGFALARHMAQGQTVVHALSATAIVEAVRESLEEFLQRPDAPSLYWALAALPRPLVDFQPGYESEMNSLYLNFPELRDLETKQYTVEQWRELLHKFLENLLHLAGSSEHQTAAVSVAVAMQGYPTAKRYLIARGRPADEVERMPVAQVLLLYTVTVYRELSDDQCKYLFLPRTEAASGLARACARFRSSQGSPLEIIPLARLLLPAVDSLKRAEMRAQAGIARLRVLEALRIYAAAHDGRLPDRLSDIREVPVPVNPSVDRAFDYRRDGARAILSGDADGGERPWRYEITISGTGERK